MSFIIEAGGPSDRDSIPLATRERNYIPNERRLEQSPAQLRAAVEIWQRERPNARLRSITAVYNCMGLVFASRRTWIEPDHISMILTDDGYSRLDGESEAKIGDIVVYKKNLALTHVGIIIGFDDDLSVGTRKMKVLSKWGANGEYIHRIDDVPVLFGVPAEFWTDRRMKP